MFILLITKEYHSPLITGAIGALMTFDDLKKINANCLAEMANTLKDTL